MTQLSEDIILKKITQYFPNTHKSVLLGRGDDCAVLRTKNSICISTDLFIEDVHFRSAYFSPEDIGYKSLAVNISDIAAMGARPVGFSLGLAFPPNIEMSWLEGFFSGMSTLANLHSLALLGGDLSRANSIYISITVWGESVRQKNFNNSSIPFLTRGGSMPGDILFLVGDIGLARIGLEELEKNGLHAKKTWPKACSAHLRPQIQVEAGMILTKSSINMRTPIVMDLSDGLARDLPRLLGVNEQGMLGAQLNIPDSMLNEEVLRHAKEHNRCAVTQAWLGGEDYALLGACVPRLFPILHSALPKFKKIGTLTRSGLIELNGAQIEQSYVGFDHFDR